MFQAAIGGTGLQGDEQLVRFIGHPDEIKALLAGGLSMTNAQTFSDKQEGAGTEADNQWISEFYGSLAEPMRKRFDQNHQAILATAYVSCWHRLSKSSDLALLANEYCPDTFQCAVTTSIERIYTSIPSPDGTPMWLDLLNVRYLADEIHRLKEVLDGEFPRCGYPTLEFKRAKFSYEQEARFVMHDYSAVLVQPGAQSLLAIDRPKWRYAAINPAAFIGCIYPLNDSSNAQVGALLSSIHYRPTIRQTTPEKLLAQCLA